MKILIDNGHGVSTHGKRSPDGVLLEYQWSRETASGLCSALRARGLDAELLVPEDGDIPLRERCARANAWCGRLGNDKVLLISIHLNASGNGGQWMPASGWEAWTSPGQTKSDRLAECLYDAAKRFLPPGTRIRTDLTDGDRDKEARFAILTGTRCPAVLTENLFMDNREDYRYLLSPEGRQAIINLHLHAILQYLGK